MIELDLTPSGDRISVSVSPRAADQMKGLPGSKWDRSLARWTMPLTLAALWQLRATFGDQLHGSEQLDDWAVARSQRVAHILAVKAGQATVGQTDSIPYLRDYQRPAVAWMATVGRCLLADEMRTGKTVMAIGVIETLGKQGIDPYPVLIVAPNSMKYVWRDEIERFLPGCTVQVINGTASQRKKQFATEADFYVINWEGMAGHSRLAPYGSVELTEKERLDKEIQELAPTTTIFDEAHRMVNPKTKQTRAAWHVMHGATYRYALTGTPVVNAPEDAWSIMHGLSPEEWPVKTKFIGRYTISAISGYGGLDVFGLNPGTQQEFYRILDPRFLRRTLREVRSEIPDVLPPQVRTVDMAPKQAKAYDDLIQHMMTETEGGLLVVDSPLVRAGRLTQAAAATLSLDEAGNVILTDPSCKLDALLEVIEEAPDEPLVVFAASRQLIDLTGRFLAGKNILYRNIVGGQHPEERALNVSDFQKGVFPILLCTTGAGSEGITLNRADRLVFLQRDWSHVKNLQAAARIDGAGLVQIIDIVTRGTIERAVHAAGDAKAERLEEIVRDHLRTGRVK